MFRRFCCNSARLRASAAKSLPRGESRFCRFLRVLRRTENLGKLDGRIAVFLQIAFGEDGVPRKERRVPVGDKEFFPAPHARDAHVGGKKDIPQRPACGGAVRRHGIFRGEGARLADAALGEHVLEKAVIDGFEAEDVADEIACRHADERGEQKGEVPGEFDGKQHARDGRPHEGGEEHRHADDDEGVGIGGGHPHARGEQADERPRARTDGEHGNECAARHACAHVEHGDAEFQEKDNAPRRPERRGKDAR